MSSTTMVFGGSGFIGRHLATALASRGGRVVVADLAPIVHEMT